MRILDTNIIVRIILGEDTQQNQKAQMILHEIVSGDQEVFIPTLVVSEVLYVLCGKIYQRNKDDAIVALQTFGQIKNISYEEEHLIEQTLEIYGSCSLAFTDCYLLIKSKILNAQLDTLDQKLNEAIF